MGSGSSLASLQTRYLLRDIVSQQARPPHSIDGTHPLGASPANALPT